MSVKKNMKIKMPIYDFWKKNGVKYLFVECNIINDEKKVKFPPLSWTKLSQEELDNKFNNNRINDKRYNLVVGYSSKECDIIMADLDNKDKEDLFTKEFGKNYKTISSGRKLPHIYLKKDSKDTNGNKQEYNIEKYGKKGVDLCYSTFYEKKSSKISYNPKKSMKVFKNFKEKSIKNKPEKPKVKKQVNKVINFDNIPNKLSREQAEIINNIDEKYINKYEDWLKIIWALHNEFNDIEICDYVSRRGNSYKDIRDVEKYLKNNNKKCLSFGTICYYSKLSDESNYIKIRSKYNILNISGEDVSLAKLYLSIVGDDIIYDGTYYYKYKKPYWVQLENDFSSLKKNINETLFKAIKSNNQVLTELKNKCEDSEDPNYKLYVEKQKINDCVSKLISSNTKLKNICEIIKCWIEKDEYDIDRVQPYYFCFRNKAFDMETRKEIIIDKYDYITIDSGYDYEEPTQEQIKTIKELINSIMPNEEKQKCLLSVLRMGCIGKQTDKFVFFTGGGGNGKGVLIENIKKLLGNYFQYATKDFLIAPPKNPDSANPVLSSFNKKRMIVFSEPDEKDKINGSTYKQITDQPILSGRQLYGKVSDIYMDNITICECNALPKISGRIDNSILRRNVTLKFDQTFTDDESLLQLENYHLKNPLFKNYDFILKHRNAFFKILLDFEENDVYIPNEVKLDSRSYVMDSDEFYTWFCENYTITDDINNIVSIKDDIFNNFICGEFYNTFSKDEKRNWNKKNIVEVVKNNNFLKKFYKERLQIGKKHYKNIITNVKQKDIGQDEGTDSYDYV